MGDWTETCAVTNTAIEGHDDCYAIVFYDTIDQWIAWHKRSNNG